MPELRAEAVRQLGVMGAHDELWQLYTKESSLDVKKQILQAMFVGGNAERLIQLAKTESDPELRRVAVRNLGLMGSKRTGDALVEIYTTDKDPEIRKAVVQGLFIQNNAESLVATRAQGERRDDEAGDRLEALADALEGGDGLPDGDHREIGLDLHASMKLRQTPEPAMRSEERSDSQCSDVVRARRLQRPKRRSASTTEPSPDTTAPRARTDVPAAREGRERPVLDRVRRAHRGRRPRHVLLVLVERHDLD